jgi:hypothetical protein
VKRIPRKNKAPNRGRGDRRWYTSDQRLLDELCDLATEIELHLRQLPAVRAALVNVADEVAAQRKAADALRSAVLLLEPAIEAEAKL